MRATAMLSTRLGYGRPAALARCLASAFCAGESEPERDADLGLGFFHGAEVFAARLFAVLRGELRLPATARRVAVFLAVVFLAAFFFDAIFLAAVFSAAVFFVAAFLAAVLPAAFRAADVGPDFRVDAPPGARLLVAVFPAEDFFAEDVRDVFFAAAFFAVRCFVAAALGTAAPAPVLVASRR